MLFTLKEFLSFYFVIPLVILCGSYLSFKSKFLQIRKLPAAYKILFKSHNTNSRLSSFSALAAVLGGNLGTGNIAGIALALSFGGPGALFWMWIMAFLGAIIKYYGCYLAIMYRSTQPLRGGPMYYLAYGLNAPWLGKLFCISALLSAITVGNMVQINSITIPLVACGFNPILIGIVFALLVGAVLLGGSKLFSEVAAKMVPLMAIIYILACLYIIFLNYFKLPSILFNIICSAFSFKTMVAGAAGFSMLDALRIGFDRGLFATDAGVGVAPMLHAQVSTTSKHHQDAYIQGLVSTIAPFIVMLICTLTGLVLLIANIDPQLNLKSTNLCIAAFQAGFAHEYAGFIVTITLMLFAFTTILTWAYCARSCLKFLTNNLRIHQAYHIVFIALIPLGCLLDTDYIWLLADISLNTMLILNIYALMQLHNKVLLH